MAQARQTEGPDPRGTSDAASSKGSSPPGISLPKGGGAIRGIGEKFAANPVTGTGSMTVPILTSPGRSGFGPQLSLSYDSGSGNGPFGFGWSLSLPAITRKTDKGLPEYRDAEESDVFVLSGAEDLVPVLAPDGKRFEDTTTVQDTTIHRYRPRIEGLFARIERWTRSDGDVHWRSISKDNILTIYGQDAGARIADSTRIFSWLICETRDDKGNAVLYEYKPENGAGVDLSRAHERNRGDLDDPRRSTNRYLKRIKYGNRAPLLDSSGHRPRALSPAQLASAGWMFEVVFDYGEHDTDVPRPEDAGVWIHRDDSFSSYRAGFEVRTTRLCRRVLMFHHFPGEPEVDVDCLVRSTDFAYSPTLYTFLRAVAQSGYRRQGEGYLKRSLPPVEFEYSQPIVQDTVEEVDAASLENLPIGLDGTSYQWLDLHGEGIPGILTEQAGGWFYKRNLSPIAERPVEFAPLELVAARPNLALAGGQAQFMDLAGDGQPDLAVLDGPTAGFYEHDGEEGWEHFRPFRSRLNRDFQDPNLKLIDLDGDGHADVLISEDDAFVWHASFAEDGFGPARRVVQALDEERGPRLVFADGTQSIYLADMCGDGLTDLVRIRNGEICYWPNHGYGRFGAKVTMDGAPSFDHPDQFDQRRVRLADVDGTGTADVIYLHGDGVRLYFNESGNSWSTANVLAVFPRVDSVVSIQVTDLLGNGTACLVWSSPLPGDVQGPMRYVNLMGGQKPHLLVKTVNNLGAETRVEYGPSTKFYLQDKRDGTPWITKLPFPVHVVERVEIYDHVSRNRFVTRYAYHHGYFDGDEREFRGFGRVDQWDTEAFAALTGDGTLPPATNLDAASHVPPVLTKTWFHTGIYLGRDRVSGFFVGEYYREPGSSDAQARALLLDDTVLPAGLTLEEEREACRALKGSMLRQEVYAFDGSAKAGHPYTVVEQNLTIEQLQARHTGRHAVFFTHPREAITYHYERNPADPRIQHALTLEVDDFGNVLKEAAIGYGRRATTRVIDDQGQVEQVPNPGLAGLTDSDQAKQTTPLLTYTENLVTNPIESADTLRNPLPCEALTFELTGYTPTGPAGRLQAADLVEPDPNAVGRLRHKFTDHVAYEAAGTANPCRRPIECLRTLYRRDDLSSLLPLGEQHSLGLPGESYKLAFTPGLLDRVYVRGPERLLPLNPADVLQGGGADRGGYVDLDGDGRWWIPSGRSFFSTNPADSAMAESAEARQHFFLSRRYRDPFGQDAIVGFDADDLLMIETRDALDNRVTVEANDYRVLQPRLISDPNRNQTAVAFDALGMVAGTAVMGKPLPAPVEGDSLDGFIADLTQDQIDGFYDATDLHASAQALLQGATTRIIYDLMRYRSEPDPGEKQPVFAATVARETHASDPVPAGGLKIQVSFLYSDGFGREIQKKIQAEPGSLVAGGQVVSPRWVGSGWTIFNNKGKPVRQYEPFFSKRQRQNGTLFSDHRFEFGVMVGVSPLLFYDPVERVVATLHPNHTYEKVAFDPWRQVTWDVNDTVLGDPRTDPDIAGYVREYFKAEPDGWQTWHAQRIGRPAGDPERDAAGNAAAHADTPTTAHLDALGRSFLTSADNGTQGNYETRVELDVEGNQRSVTDALGRIVMRNEYSIAGPEKDKEAANRIHQSSMEAGERWTLNDVTGKPIRAWDSRAHGFRTAYDELRRPAHSFVIGADVENPTSEICFEETVYGESTSGGLSAAQILQGNFRGKPYKHYDTAGVVTSEVYDFKGNLLRSARQVVRDYKATPDWSQTPRPALEKEIFASSTRHDALNRPIQMVAPHSDQADTRINVIQPGYNEADLLERLDAWLGQTAEPSALLDPSSANLHAVTNIDYDAKGQRTCIDYGNGVKTQYTYDRETFRLTSLTSTRPVTFPADERVVQDLSYTYDPAGNITHIQDDADIQNVVFFRNQRVEPSTDYTYDAIYRLINATGREHIGQFAQPQTTWNDELRVNLPHPGDGQAMGTYTEQYVYDAVGNFEQLIHHASNGGWTRAYAYTEASLIEVAKKSNRLTSTTIGATTEPYTYDAHGNMTSMPHLTLMQWDFKDQLSATARQAVNTGVPETTHYIYDGAGQRVRKVTERQNGSRKAERIYLGGLEIYHEFNSNDTGIALEHETLHIMDDKQRIALVETRTFDTAGNDPAPLRLIRYQLGNHLGSASLELDDQARIASYEEYASYGSTSYQAVRSQTETAKRYRYTGKERDEENGLYFHGARYYAPWLGRWMSADPAGMVDGVNLYTYAIANPLNLYDPDGTQSQLLPLQPEDKRALEALKKVGTGQLQSFNQSTDTETFTAQIKLVQLAPGKEATESFLVYDIEKHAILQSEVVISAEKPDANLAVADATQVAASPVVVPLQTPPTKEIPRKPAEQPSWFTSSDVAVADKTSSEQSPVVLPFTPEQQARREAKKSDAEKRAQLDRQGVFKDALREMRLKHANPFIKAREEGAVRLENYKRSGGNSRPMIISIMLLNLGYVAEPLGDFRGARQARGENVNVRPVIVPYIPHKSVER